MAEEKAKKQANPAVIQTVKTIAVLVVICLVCGALLALCNDLLFIDDTTSLERKLRNSVWPTYEFKAELDVVSANANASYGRVNKVYESKDDTYVIEALGSGGYQGGSVTLYVVVGKDALIKAWAVKTNDKQSYIDRIPSDAGTKWYVGKDVSNELALEMTGATVVLTSTAINNAINMAAYYCRTALGLGEDPEGDAKNAAIELLAAKGYTYTANSLTKFNVSAVGTALNGEKDTLTYIFVATGDDGIVFIYVYGEGDGIKIVAVKDGAIIANSDSVTGEEDFVTNILAKPIMQIAVTDTIKLFTFISDIKTDENKQVYIVVGIKLAGWDPNNYILEITIEADDAHGKVTKIGFAADGNGFVEHGPDMADANKLIDSLLGATSATIDDTYNRDKVGGATQSANIITAAIKAALTHFDANLASND